MNLPSHPILILNIAQGEGHGAEKVLSYLLVAEAEHLRKTVLVASPQNSSIYTTAQSHGYGTIAWNSQNTGLISNMLALGKFLAGDCPDLSLIHAWQGDAFEVACCIAALKKIPATGTIHDTVASYYGDPHIDLNYHTYRHFLWAKAAYSMAMIAAPSQATATDWQNLFGITAVAVQNGVPYCPPVSRATSLNQPIEVGFLGCYAFWKGLDLLHPLIAATQDLPIHWNLYGDLHPSMRCHADKIKANFSQRVTFHGQQPTEAIFPTLDLVLHPSTRHDPYPTVLLETARAGLPAIASNVGGSGEIVSPGETGFLFTSGDIVTAEKYLRLLVVDASLRKQMGQTARQRFLSHFQANSMVSRYEAFWNRVLNGNHL